MNSLIIINIKNKIVLFLCKSNKIGLIIAFVFILNINGSINQNVKGILIIFSEFSLNLI